MVKPAIDPKDQSFHRRKYTRLLFFLSCRTNNTAKKQKKTMPVKLIAIFKLPFCETSAMRPMRKEFYNCAHFFGNKEFDSNFI